MIRISTIFIAICMVLIAASLGVALYALFGLNRVESGIVALTALTFLILYNAVSMRLRDRHDVGGQIADLSRGTADLARQVGEFGRRLAAIENRIANVNNNGADRNQAVLAEINDLGAIVKQLAISVAAHDDALAERPQPAAVAAAQNDDLEWTDTGTANIEEAPAPAAETPVAPRPTAPAPTPAATAPPAAKPAASAPEPAAPVSPDIIPIIRKAIDNNQVEIFLQPIVTLPQRKVRFYEAMSRVRDDNNQLLSGGEFIAAAESAGLMGRIDSAVLFRCVQVLRRLMVRSKEVGVFCNLSATTLADKDSFAQCLDFLEANRALAPSFVVEFKQSMFRNLSPLQGENLAALAQRGFRFSMDNVTDLRIDARELADRGVRYVKVPGPLLLDPKQSVSDIHPADLSDLLGRSGIDLIAERIEGERAVVDLLDYDVRFGQGFLFAEPKPIRPETAPVPPDTGKPAASSDAAKPGSPNPPQSERLTGNAALVRRAARPS
ncbi:MAG: diguanylate phosphodiesterase [Proteobacteria bacterium SG_bin9]|nr:MAG: diguanylate phosphodiesterase [Proteobacteria bacterium SG_bin9]